jgi:pimeloyl-ACP methyl ester carboxylesterase
MWLGSFDFGTHVMKSGCNQNSLGKISLTALLLFWSVTTAGQQTTKGYPPPGKLIDIGGYRLHLNCTGNKRPTVVLIAGAGDFSFDWSLVQPSIAQFARVCSYDRAGFGWSDPGPTPRTMKQEAFEVHTLLNAAHIKPPYVLIGHSIGGLVGRVYARQYPREVAGVVLIDSTHEDTTLMLNGKLAHIRELAKPDPVPSVQTIKSSPPKPFTKEDLNQFESDLKSNGPPKITAPFDKLPPSIQAMRLYFLSQPPRAAGGGMDFLAEELRDMYAERAKTPYPLGNLPLVVLLAKAAYGKPPRDIDADEWQRVNEEKRQQKIEFTNLSRNSKLIVAEKSGHHIQLDEPQVVIDAVRLVVESLRRHQTLDGKKL